MTQGLKVSRRLSWRLRHMMVERNIITAADLARRLTDIGFVIDRSQVSRIVKMRPVEIKTEFLDALLEVLQCDIQDLLRAEPVDPSVQPASPTPESEKTQTTPTTKKARSKKAAPLPTPAIPRGLSLVPPELKKPGT